MLRSGLHGGATQPVVGVAYLAVGAALIWRGRLEEAERWLQREERTLRAEGEPAAGLLLYHVRAELELARGRAQEALAAVRAADRLAGRLVAPYWLATRTRAVLLPTPVRMGRIKGAQGPP